MLITESRGYTQVHFTLLSPILFETAIKSREDYTMALCPCCTTPLQLTSTDTKPPNPYQKLFTMARPAGTDLGLGPPGGTAYT